MLALTLRARLDAPVAEVLATIERIAREHTDEVVVAQPDGDRVTLALHPAASAAELYYQAGTLRLEAETGSAGPGYHAAVCELADRLAEGLALRWKAELDPALFFAHRDRAALERVVLDELRETARQILELARGGATGFALYLPEGLEVAHEGLLATLLGPRDRAWIERVLEDPQAGTDAYAWWGPDRDARHHRGVALARMWLEVRWRKPQDDAERALLDRVVTSLERAFGMDASLEYPWAAWAEVFDLLGEESLRATRARLKAADPRERQRERPGYRRRAVRVALSGGWSIAIPGELSERWDDRGTWVAVDPKRSAWITSAEAPEGHDTEATLAGLPPLEGAGDTLAMERGPIRGAVRFETKDDEHGKLHVAHAHAALGPHLVVATFLARTEDERETFLEMWGSLDHPDASRA